MSPRPTDDGAATQQLAATTPAEAQLRRKDDMRKSQFRQSTAQYSMANVSVITAVLFWLTSIDKDLGENIGALLTWIVVGHVFVILSVAGFKSWEIVSSFKPPAMPR